MFTSLCASAGVQFVCAYAGLFVYASACVCVMRVLRSTICVCAAGPGDPGAVVWSVGREGEG